LWREILFLFVLYDAPDVALTLDVSATDVTHPLPPLVQDKFIHIMGGGSATPLPPPPRHSTHRRKLVGERMERQESKLCQMHPQNKGKKQCSVGLSPPTGLSRWAGLSGINGGYNGNKSRMGDCNKYLQVGWSSQRQRISPTASRSRGRRRGRRPSRGRCTRRRRPPRPCPFPRRPPPPPLPHSPGMLAINIPSTT